MKMYSCLSRAENSTELEPKPQRISLHRYCKEVCDDEMMNKVKVLNCAYGLDLTYKMEQDYAVLLNHMIRILSTTHFSTGNQCV